MARKHLQEPGIARAVDADRADNDDLHSAASAGRSRRALALELGFLVDVSRRQRRFLVRGRMLDVSVHATLCCSARSA